MNYWIVRTPPFIRGDYFNLVVVTPDHDTAVANYYVIAATYPAYHFEIWVADEEGNIL